MDALKTLMLEGNFYLDHQSLWVKSDTGETQEVEPLLKELEGRQIRLAVMHVPPSGPKPGRWGGGSCNIEVAGTECPAGHHLHPDRMLVFSQEGVLTKTPQGWVLCAFDGGIQSVPLNMMWGHYGRILGATTDAVERMRDKLANLSPDQQVESLIGQAGDLTEMLEKLRKATGSK